MLPAPFSWSLSSFSVLFGPVRAFLNRLLAVLPVSESRPLHRVQRAAKTAAGPSRSGLGYGANGNGVHDAKRKGRPFHFIVKTN